MFAHVKLLPVARVQSAWEAFKAQRHEVSMDELPPEVARFVQHAWNDGWESRARVEQEMAEERELGAR